MKKKIIFIFSAFLVILAVIGAQFFGRGMFIPPFLMLLDGFIPSCLGIIGLQSFFGGIRITRRITMDGKLARIVGVFLICLAVTWGYYQGRSFPGSSPVSSIEIDAEEVFPKEIGQPVFYENGVETHNEQLFASLCATIAEEEQSLNELSNHLLQMIKSGELAGVDAAERYKKEISSKWAEKASRFEEISIPSSSQSAKSHQFLIAFCKTRRNAYLALSEGLMTDSEDKFSEYNLLMEKADKLGEKTANNKNSQLIFHDIGFS